MGLFSKLRANMNHGGVTVHVQAPSSVASNQMIPVQVTLTADSLQTVTSIKVDLRARMEQQGVSFDKGMGVEANGTTEQSVAVVENRTSLNLTPGQPQTINLELFLSGNTSSGMAVQTGIGTVGGALGGVLQTAMAATQAFNHINFVYTLHAYADVEGIALDPSDKQSIQILPPVENTTPTLGQVN